MPLRGSAGKRPPLTTIIASETCAIPALKLN
jgi:hypothetical protein